ncbi:DOPA 4,5-dioxygenase family protein [Ghiorsea bivora]|uniref:DOPA 4,5-dioxygenase family protein n=1 Tax=Ghiorsea bivora TaxID=1485545 RepID=UPI00068FAE3B|nr:DOPA 4,5-dioxygenase family protein [Ghiorsea bivora]
MDTNIMNYHAHIYYNESTFEQASKLCDEVGVLFDVPVGFKHQQPVGPHPMWSCQISLTAEKFAEVVPWLMLNRKGLTVFIHGNTGDDLKDHTEHTMWMGSIESLNLDIFK